MQDDAVCRWPSGPIRSKAQHILWILSMSGSRAASETPAAILECFVHSARALSALRSVTTLIVPFTHIHGPHKAEARCPSIPERCSMRSRQRRQGEMATCVVGVFLASLHFATSSKSLPPSFDAQRSPVISSTVTKNTLSFPYRGYPSCSRCLGDRELGLRAQKRHLCSAAVLHLIGSCSDNVANDHRGFMLHQAGSLRDI
jgi:hypothetical protein